MTKRKMLNEAVQLAEARAEHYKQLWLQSTSGFIPEYSKINPAVVNSADYIRVLSTADKIQACSRYVTEIPELELPSNRLEALWYDYGSLAFYREKDRVLVSSYAKTGDLNELGDLTEVYPIDFAGKVHSEKKTVVYTNRLVKNPVVIINDYTGTYLEGLITPRRTINSVSIGDQAKVYQQLRNAVKLTAKKAIALIDSEPQRQAAEKILNDWIDNDSPVISLISEGLGSVVKMFNLDTKLDIEGYMRAVETYEKMRANFNGISTKSPIEKKERLITAENESANMLTNIYLQDGLVNRQIGIELMKKHSIIHEGSCKINPVLQPKEESEVKKNGE